MALIDKDKVLDAIAMYLFINDAIKSQVPMKVADYKTFAESILKDVPEVDAIPRDYYEKVVGELCRKHTEEIASMPDIVKCKECRYWVGNISEDDGFEDECKWITEEAPNADDFCSYGERADRKE